MVHQSRGLHPFNGDKAVLILLAFESTNSSIIYT